MEPSKLASGLLEASLFNSPDAKSEANPKRNILVSAKKIRTAFEKSRDSFRPDPGGVLLVQEVTPSGRAVGNDRSLSAMDFHYENTIQHYAVVVGYLQSADGRPFIIAFRPPEGGHFGCVAFAK